MKYFVFLFYLLSYTTGIGAIALLNIQYLRYQLMALRNLIFFDLFATLFLIVDTLNFYFQAIIHYHSVGFQSLVLWGSFLASIGMAYFLDIYVCRILNRKFDRTFKIFLWGGAILTGGILILLYVLCLNGLISIPFAFHTGFTTTNFYIFVAFGNSLYLSSKNINKFGLKKKSMMTVILGALFIILPASILTNLLLYQVHIKYPISYTPLSYLIFNSAIIFYIIRNYMNKIPDEITNIHAFKSENLLVAHDEIIRERNITEREFEVLQLILAGKGNQEIGNTLFISSNTVRNHIYSIFKKLGIKNRYELIKLFY